MIFIACGLSVHLLWEFVIKVNSSCHCTYMEGTYRQSAGKFLPVRLPSSVASRLVTALNQFPTDPTRPNLQSRIHNVTWYALAELLMNVKLSSNVL